MNQLFNQIQLGNINQVALILDRYNFPRDVINFATSQGIFQGKNTIVALLLKYNPTIRLDHIFHTAEVGNIELLSLLLEYDEVTEDALNEAFTRAVSKNQFNVIVQRCQEIILQLFKIVFTIIILM